MTENLIALEGPDYVGLLASKLRHAVWPTHIHVGVVGEVALIQYEGYCCTLSPETVEKWVDLEEEELEEAWDRAWNGGHGFLRVWADTDDDDEPSFVPVTHN